MKKNLFNLDFNDVEDRFLKEDLLTQFIFFNFDFRSHYINFEVNEYIDNNGDSVYYLQSIEKTGENFDIYFTIDEDDIYFSNLKDELFDFLKDEINIFYRNWTENLKNIDHNNKYYLEYIFIFNDFVKNHYSYQIDNELLNFFDFNNKD